MEFYSKQKNCYIVIGFTDGEPEFGRIDEILVLATTTVVFIVYPCTCQFDDNLYAYHITRVAINGIVFPYCNLKDYSVYHCHKLDHSNSCIIPKYVHID